MLRGEALYKLNRFREAIRDFTRRQRMALQRGEHMPQAQAWMWLGEVWLGLDSLWPDVFSARASCADAAVSLLGISYDLLSLALFLAVGLALLTLLRRRGQGRIQ